MREWHRRLMERLEFLGEIVERSEERFYVVFRPFNNKAVEVLLEPGGVRLRKLYVERYEPLTMWSSMNESYENLTDPEAFDVVLSIKEGLDGLWILPSDDADPAGA